MVAAAASTAWSKAPSPLKSNRSALTRPVRSAGSSPAGGRVPGTPAHRVMTRSISPPGESTASPASAAASGSWLSPIMRHLTEGGQAGGQFPGAGEAGSLFSIDVEGREVGPQQRCVGRAAAVLPDTSKIRVDIATLRSP